MKRLGSFLLGVFLLTPVLAHEGGNPGRIRGNGIDLVWHDHVLSGRFRGATLRAVSLTEEFGAHLRHRVEGRIFESVLRRTGERLGAVVESVDSLGRPMKTTFEVTDASGDTVSGTLDGTPFTVRLSADKRNGHHWVSPRFQVRLGAREFAFRMQGGQACLGCAVKIVYVVLSMGRVTGAF